MTTSRAEQRSTAGTRSSLVASSVPAASRTMTTVSVVTSHGTPSPSAALYTSTRTVVLDEVGLRSAKTSSSPAV